MEQTFLNYALTDVRFSLASAAAILRTLLFPLTMLLGGTIALGAGPMDVIAVFAAMLLWGMVEWMALIVRMARRIALGRENPGALLDHTVGGLTGHLVRAYF